MIKGIDAPTVKNLEPENLQALISNIDFDPFKGKMGMARITNGVVKAGQAVALDQLDKDKTNRRIEKILAVDNLGHKEVEEAKAAEIIMFSGLENIEIGDTLIIDENSGQNAAGPLPPIAVEQPTVRMTIGVNKPPLAGQDETFLTSRMIRDCLFNELD